MPRFAKELPLWTQEFKTAASIDMGKAAQLRTEVGKLGDRYLATMYCELLTAHKMSILADVLEYEIVDRFCEQNMMVPELALADG